MANWKKIGYKTYNLEVGAYKVFIICYDDNTYGSYIEIGTLLFTILKAKSLKVAKQKAETKLMELVAKDLARIKKVIKEYEQFLNG